MLEQKKAAIFDMDGTLMDSMWMWRDIDIEYLGRFGRDLPRELQFEIEGMGFTETACYFKEKFQIPQTVEEIKADWNKMAYDIYANRVFLKPGALELLREMKARGMKLGIATSNHIDLAMAALVSNQVEGMFDCILTSCDVARGKPSPDVYLAVADRLQVEPEECIVFEDVPMGILAGKNAGMQVCAVEDAFSLERKKEICSLADYYIRSFKEVLEQTYEVTK